MMIIYQFNEFNDQSDIIKFLILSLYYIILTPRGVHFLVYSVKLKMIIIPIAITTINSHHSKSFLLTFSK
jgi:hypothetical protein